MSTSNENDLICGSIDKEVTPETSKTLETSENLQTPAIENEESELEDYEYCDDEMETSSEEEDAFAMDFMGCGFYKLDIPCF